MEVLMLEKRSRPLPSGATQNYPKDWSGDVPDELARQWIEDNAAVALAGAEGALFTPDQAFVLRHAANQMIDQINAEHESNASESSGEGDSENEDVNDAGGKEGENDDDAGAEEEEEVLNLEDMTDDDLAELCKEAKIRSYGSMKRETRIAKLRETLQADADDADTESA